MTDWKKCPHCGKRLHKDARYCMYCMHSFQQKKDVTPDSPSNSGKLVMIAICLILGCAMLILLFSVIVAGSNTGSHDGQSYRSGNTATGGQILQNKTTLPDASADDPGVPGVSSPVPEVTQPEQMTPGHEENADPGLTEPPFSEENQPGVTDPAEQPDNPAVGEGESEIESPQVTEPPATVPPATEPPVTEPPETEPPVTAPPCRHYYMEATCSAPMTCVYCGNTWGTVDVNAHDWSPDIVTVHHEEVGHYEEQTDYVKRIKYLCFFCGYNQDGFYSMDDLREHITVHSHYTEYNLIVKNLELNTDTWEVWEPVTETVWVVEREEYDETVIVSYTCTRCGDSKEP